MQNYKYNNCTCINITWSWRIYLFLGADCRHTL